jgi:glycosyltransferase involved in cell wall biosynthesis
MKPRISIITPSYNQGKFVRRTIESVLTQNVQELEYLVIDGGSKDGTVPILQEYGKTFYWISEKDKGHPDAINKGIMRSNGTIIGWLNSDDIYYPGALQAVLSFFDSHPHIDVVYGDANHIDEHDAFIEKYPTEEWNWEKLKEVCYISQPATFLRRSVFDRFGLMDVSLRQSQDYEYWIRIGKQGANFAYLPRLLAATRLHSEAFTVGSRVACHKLINDFTRHHLGNTPDRWIFNYSHAVVESWGYRRSDPLRFAMVVSLVSLYASLRWNKKISKNILNTISHWIGGNARDAIRKKFPRLTT